MKEAVRAGAHLEGTGSRCERGLARAVTARDGTESAKVSTTAPAIGSPESLATTRRMRPDAASFVAAKSARAAATLTLAGMLVGTCPDAGAVEAATRIDSTSPEPGTESPAVLAHTTTSAKNASSATAAAVMR